MELHSTTDPIISSSSAGVDWDIVELSTVGHIMTSISVKSSFELLKFGGCKINTSFPSTVVLLSTKTSRVPSAECPITTLPTVIPRTFANFSIEDLCKRSDAAHERFES